VLWTTVAAVAFGGACASDDRAAGPTAPAAEAAISTAPAQAAPGRGIDAEFSRLAAQVPGFGGMYYDRTGRLNVYVARGQAGAALRSADVVGRLRAAGGADVQRRLQSSQVTVREASYDYQQLQRWKSSLRKVFSVKGVVYTDIDEASNRVRIAITPAASQAAVERVVTAAGVPRGAVTYTRSSPITALKTVRDRFRPVPAGAQIVFPAPSVGEDALFVCTIGFNARIPSQPDQRFFVTASHCSDVQGGNQHTPYYQPDPFISNPSNNRIAFEFKDPQYGNPGGLCVYEGARCRLADALLARYTTPSNAQIGKIARTTFGLSRIGSMIIDPNHPRWNIVGEFGFPFLGEEAHKVGRTTGWTHGPVVATCVDVGVTGSDIVEICQDIVFAGVRGGDSGSGVFERAAANSSDVFLTGVLWGGGTDENGATVFVFSAMENIEAELGPLATSPGPLFASAQ